jgi:putative Ca2+/H+ antiporter (TMEM165/GDT1 family)
MEWKLFLTVFASTMLSHVISVRVMSIVAGSGFMLIGAWTLYHGLNQAQ